MRCTSDGPSPMRLILQLAVPALQRHLLRHAEAAENLDRAVHHAAGGFRRNHLGDGGFDLEVAAKIARPRRLIDQQARRAELHLAIGDHPLDRLLLRQLRAECFSLQRPVGRHLDRRLRGADHVGGVGNAALDQPFLRDLEALPLLAEPVLDRDRRVVEVDLVGRVGADDRNALEADPRRVAVDDEAGDPAAFSLCAGAREKDAPVAIARVGDPHLRAVDDVAVAVAHRAAADRARRIGAAGGFAESRRRLSASPRRSAARSGRSVRASP